MPESISFRFRCDGLSDDTFRVASFSGEEGVSELYRFEIDLVCERDDLGAEGLQNRAGELVLRGAERTRTFQGVIARVEVREQMADCTVYRVALVPRVWALTLSTAHAVYLQRTTPEIVRGVLEDRVGITSADSAHALEARPYEASPFRLQYGETDWAFLSALMEHEGIYYYFRAGEDSEQIVFCDHVESQPEVEGPVEYAAELGLQSPDGGGRVHALVQRHERLPAAVEVSNYDDDRPSVAIHARATVDDEGSGTVHLYGHGIRSPQEAETIAGIRAEELRCRQSVYHGESTAFQLAAGHRFTLGGHPRERCNGAYQLVAIGHHGHDPEVCGRIGRSPDAEAAVYHNHFTALPGDIQYRPPRETERPSIQGTLNACIDAEGDGTFAEPDGEGRYHVVFPFHPGFHDGDRADAGKASHWVRLVQPYGGQHEGMHFPLRKGTRVLVGFVGGNPDLPVITGTVPNASQPSPLGDRNLAKGTIRTPGGNLIETDDEYPRVKLYSPTCRTYMHLGASNAPGYGLVTVTDGLAQWMALGGMSMTAGTQGWLVESDIWPIPTSDDRNTELKWYTLNEAGARESESEWSMDDTIERFFQFPLKHKRPSEDDLKYRPYHADYVSAINASEDENVDDAIVREDELSNFVHTTRKIGEEYSYRSGTDFAFLGPQREIFTFGPQATLDSYSHDADPEELRGPLRAILEKITGRSGAWDELGESGDDYNDARIAYRLAREKRLRKEALLIWNREINLDENEDKKDLKARFEKGLANEGNRAATIWAVVKQAAKEIAEDAAGEIDLDDNEGLDADDIKLIYATDIADRINKIADGDYYDTDDIKGAPDEHFKAWFQSNLDPQSGSTEKLDYDKNRDEQCGASSDYLDSLIDEHAGARKKYDDAWEKVQCEKDAELALRIRNGRLSVSDLTNVSVHNGESINYVRGRSYSETDVVDPDSGGATDGNLCGVDFVGGNDSHEHDLAAWSGPRFGKINAGVGEGWQEERVNVSKTIGNTYSYQSGHAASVHIGDVHQVTKLGHIKEEHKHPRSGDTISFREGTFGVEGHEAGWTEFSATYIPSIALNMNLALRHTVTINSGLCTNSTVNVLGVANNTVNLVGVATNNIHAGISATVDIYAGACARVTMAAALATDAQYGQFVNVKNSTYEANMQGLAQDLGVNRLESRTNKLKNAVTELASAQFEMTNRQAQVDAARAHIYNAQWEMHN